MCLTAEEISKLSKGAKLYYTNEYKKRFSYLGEYGILQSITNYGDSYGINLHNDTLYISQGGIGTVSGIPIFEFYNINNDGREYCYWHPDIKTISFEKFRYCPICKR